MIDKLNQPASLIIRISLTCLDYTCINTHLLIRNFFFFGDNFYKLSFKKKYRNVTLLTSVICFVISTSFMITIRRGCLSSSRLWKGPKQIQENCADTNCNDRSDFVVSLSTESRSRDLTLETLTWLSRTRRSGESEILGITRSLMLDVANGNELCAI